jgi:hypothetical protein
MGRSDTLDGLRTGIRRSCKAFNEHLLVRHGYRIHARHATRGGHGMIVTFT